MDVQWSERVVIQECGKIFKEIRDIISRGAPFSADHIQQEAERGYTLTQNVYRRIAQQEQEEAERREAYQKKRAEALQRKQKAGLHHVSAWIPADAHDILKTKMEIEKTDSGPVITDALRVYHDDTE